MKPLLCAVLLIAVCLVPMGSRSVTPAPPDEEITASVTVIFNDVPDIYAIPEDAIVLRKECDCDQEMLIPVEPTNDPGFIVATGTGSCIYIEIQPDDIVPER